MQTCVCLSLLNYTTFNFSCSFQMLFSVLRNYSLSVVNIQSGHIIRKTVYFEVKSPCPSNAGKAKRQNKSLKFYCRFLRSCTDLKVRQHFFPASKPSCLCSTTSAAQTNRVEEISSSNLSQRLFLMHLGKYLPFG